MVIVNRHQLLIAKKKTKPENDPTHCYRRIIEEKIKNKAHNKFIAEKGCVIQINIKVRTKINEGGSYKNSFFEIASQQNYGKTNSKKD